MKNIITIILCTFCASLIGQYTFSDANRVACTSVKNQQKTGTCWSFATSSFIESELMRSGMKDVNLSEMYVVRNIYEDKAMNYVLRQGKANFSQGSLSHDLIKTIARYGIVPDSAYPGRESSESPFDHSEMERGLKGFLDGILKSKRLSKKWKIAFNRILDTYLGEEPSEFTVGGKRYSPVQYAESLGFNADNFVSFTSFTHHPFYKNFILEIPDNYSNGAFYNIPLNDLESIVDNAISKGYTVAWDGDVSEAGFSAKEGIAVLPSDQGREDIFTMLGAEMTVSQSSRQEEFERYSTTDDHLMHLVGKAKDQKGNEYYIIKNSWGPISQYKGYLYMSKAYFRMKTIAVMLHKDGITPQINRKLNMSE